MPKDVSGHEEALEAIRAVAQALGHPPSRMEFKAKSPYSLDRIYRLFGGWREAVRAAGLEPSVENVRIPDGDLFADWAALVRKLRRIPTLLQYDRQGKFSAAVFRRRFGVWYRMPELFREFAKDSTEWVDVLALLPVTASAATPPAPASSGNGDGIASVATVPPTHFLPHSHAKLDNRPTYGAPMDFRGLRHEPVNEQGVVFLFGMVARELGYLVEAVQTGFPDCDAKRQVAPGKWQHVRIEFEYESRNFRGHGHDQTRCDVVVCWKHNWPDCPPTIEVVELASVIKALARSED
jgi:hypothetical protein